MPLQSNPYPRLLLAHQRAGIYSGDEAFQPILGNAQLVGKLNAQPVAGCVPAAHKAAPLDPVSDCKATWVDGRAGTGG